MSWELLGMKKMNNQLEQLPKLPRTHYTHNNANGLFRDLGTLDHWARITGTITLNAEWPSDRKIKMALEVSKRRAVKFAVGCQPFAGKRVWDNAVPPHASGFKMAR